MLFLKDCLVLLVLLKWHLRYKWQVILNDILSIHELYDFDGNCHENVTKMHFYKHLKMTFEFRDQNFINCCYDCWLLWMLKSEFKVDHVGIVVICELEIGEITLIKMKIFVDYFAFTDRIINTFGRYKSQQSLEVTD